MSRKIRILHITGSFAIGAYFCRNHGIDIVHGHNYSSYRYAYFLSMLTGITLFTSNYGLGLWKKRRHLLFESLVFRRAKVNISISGIRENAREYYSQNLKPARLVREIERCYREFA